MPQLCRYADLETEHDTAQGELARLRAQSVRESEALSSAAVSLVPPPTVVAARVWGWPPCGTAGCAAKD